MKTEGFDQLLAERLAKIEAVLGSKAREYASDSDRLHNFKAAGELQRCSPERALLGMLSKHLISVVDMIMDFIVYAPEVVDEKIGDSINYLILLEALMKERYLLSVGVNK